MNFSLKIQNSESRIQNPKFSPDSRLMLFELSVGGHYPSYIQHLIHYWRDQDLPGQLDVVVSPQFLEQHRDLVEDVGNRTHFVAITPQEEAALSPRSSGKTRAIRAFQEWQLIRQYATSLKADHCLIPYFDTRQLPLALGATLPCPFSGIYFRPTFHYHTFENCVASRQDWMQRSREKLLMRRILAHPQLQTLFCLDPFVLKPLEHLNRKVNLVYLPDPVQLYPHSSEVTDSLRAELGIEAGRKVFLLFGALDRRKGIYELLKATAMLSSEACQQLCLLFVGLIDPLEKPQVEAQIAALRRTPPAQGTCARPIQIICSHQFVLDRNIQSYFQLADVVLAPYQRHVGMSGILVRAAAAQTPVLSSSYGLMGEITRRHQLGLTVDSTDPGAIADGMNALLQTPSNQIGDRAQIQAFAEQNSAQRFANVIFDTIWTDQPQTL